MFIKKMKTKDIVLISLFVAIITVLSQLAIPLPSGVPITLQVFAIVLCGYFLGTKAIIAVAIYILMGAVGVPVFAGFKGGFGALVGVTGGFIWGFLPLVFFAAMGKGKSPITAIILGLTGLLICNLLGALQFGAVTGNGFVNAIMVACLPYIIKDIILVIGAYYISIVLIRRIENHYK